GDPRLAAAALEYLRDDRFVPLVETHVLPNLIAGNHRVRERAGETVRYFGLAAVPALLDVVRSGSRRERIAVARLLGAYPIARRVRELAGLAGLIDDRPLAERAADLRARVLDPPRTIDELLRRCAIDGNWVTRLVACHTVGAAGRAGLADALAAVVASPRPA